MWGRAASIALALVLTGCATSRPRDYLLNPKPAGTDLKLFGYLGPGARVIAENRLDLEEGASQLQTQLHGDVNYGFAGGAAHADVRVMVLSLGASAGMRYQWHALVFEPDEKGLDHGEPELNREARTKKDADDDIRVDHWGWAEGRAQLVMPFHHHFMAITNIALRYEDRLDQSFSWEHATVYDKGHLWRWETLMFLRDTRWGFIGPAVRLFNLPRDDERAHEFHYGVAGGTRPRWIDGDDALLLRVYTSAGFDAPLMGTHFYRIPIQVVFGYQAEVDF